MFSRCAHRISSVITAAPPTGNTSSTACPWHHSATAAGNPVGGAGAVQPIKRGDAPWDGVMKHAPAGYVFARTITDDTMPGGPVQRTIEYAAPFDRCDREQDYETTWKFFEEKYKGNWMR